MDTAAPTAAPERARWPRLTAAPRPRLRPLLARGYAGFTESTIPRHLVLPATTSVPLVVKLLDSPHRPPAFVMGAHGSSTVVEGDCAPSYLEVLLAPLGAYTLLGLPIDQLSGQIVDLVDVLGPAGPPQPCVAAPGRAPAAGLGPGRGRRRLCRPGAPDPDFHQFTGTTPTQLQARTLPSQVDGEQEVNSVQDAVAAGS
jgi:hypothetical protein